MKVRFLGFTVTCKGELTLAQLMNFVKDQDAYGFAGYQRLIRAAEKDGYFVGLVVTFKTQRRICELEKEELVIQVRELEAGKSIVDFNFFVINQVTGRGLYQHYHHSMSLQRFGTLLDRQMRMLVERKVAAAVEKAESKGEDLNDSDKRRLRKKYRTKVELTQIVKEEDLPDLISEMDRIKRLSFDVATVTPDSPLFAPMSGLVRTTRTQLTFDREVSVEKVRKAVLSLVGKVQPTRGKIVGEIVGGSDDGVEHVISLLENYDVYGEVGYDEAAGTMNLKIEDFAKAKMVKRLLEAAKKHKGTFEAGEAA